MLFPPVRGFSFCVWACLWLCLVGAETLRDVSEGEAKTGVRDEITFTDSFISHHQQKTLLINSEAILSSALLINSFQICRHLI